MIGIVDVDARVYTIKPTDALVDVNDGQPPILLRVVVCAESIAEESLTDVHKRESPPIIVL